MPGRPMTMLVGMLPRTDQYEPSVGICYGV